MSSHPHSPLNAGSADSAPRTGRRPSGGRRAIGAFLIAIPVVLVLATPLYQRTEPSLGGIPFFYWFQISTAVMAATGCGITYLLLFHGKPDSDVEAGPAGGGH